MPLYYIAKAEREPMIKAFSEANLMMDGSTDKSVLEEEIGYTRCAHTGQVDVYMLHIREVAKADAETTAKTVKEEIKDKLEIKDEWKTITLRYYDYMTCFLMNTDGWCEVQFKC